jgi:branched-chain amino acid aminotransferase
MTTTRSTEPRQHDRRNTVLPVPPAPYPYLWFSGEQLPWEEALVHVTTVGWPAISAIFEGIRGYWNDEQRALYIFRLPEHMARFDNSVKLQRMRPRFSGVEIGEALLQLCRSNNAREDVYIQPMAFSLGAIWGSRAALDASPEVLITVRPSDSTLGSTNTLTAGVASWRRISDEALPPRIKAFPNYANSRLASNEAARHGYDAPIFLNSAGKVSESSGSCLFIIRKGVVITPPITASILESITRESVIELCRDGLGLPVVERDVDRTELYVADEAFLCGTAMEVTPLTEIDGFPVGNGSIGENTSNLEQLFHNVVRNREPRYTHWVTRV